MTDPTPLRALEDLRGPVDRERIERAVREILLAIGEDPDRDGLLRTPGRVADMYAEICAGLFQDPASHLVVTFEADHDEMVLVRDIPLYSICVPSKQPVNAVGGAKQAAAVSVGDWLWTFDEDGRLAQTQVLSAGWRNARELVEFRVGGRSVRVTPEHPVMTPGGWVEAGALVVGEKVQTAEPRRLCQQRFEVNEGYALGYALGAVGSDGSIQDGRRISFVVNDLSFAERYARSLSIAFGVESKIEPIEVPSGFLGRLVQMYRVRTVSRHIASMMLHWFGGSKATKEFHFPRVVLRSLEMARGFIDGYCDGDGHTLKKPKGARYIISANLEFLDELAVIVGSHAVVDPRGIGKVYVSRLWHEPRHGRRAFETENVPLVPPDDAWTEIESIQRVKAEGTKPYRVYSFQCSPYPTFLVGGVQTHNCEHHLIPFHGRAHVAYIPNEDGRITGLSKLARLVDGFAKRPQVQERLTTQIADALVTALAPRGAFVMIEAEHLCMSMRGVRKPGTLTVTSAVRGLFKDSPSTRAEVMAMLGPLGGRL
jgi:GTP cyclohydrolase I